MTGSSARSAIEHPSGTPSSRYKTTPFIYLLSVSSPTRALIDDSCTFTNTLTPEGLEKPLVRSIADLSQRRDKVAG